MPEGATNSHQSTTMPPSTPSPTLASLSPVPYLDDHGVLTAAFDGKVGIYAILDGAEQLQYVGYSRDVGLSLRQHLVRQPQACHSVKVQAVERPSRALLEGLRDAWIAENGGVPAGNGTDLALWTQPIDAKQQMTAAEQQAYDTGDELDRPKLLKKIARRVEGEVLNTLKDRGVTMELRFNPKLKEAGLLDLK